MKPVTPPPAGELRDLMFSLGWKLHLEDYEGTLWVKTVAGKPMETVVAMLTLAGVHVRTSTRHFISTP